IGGGLRLLFCAVRRFLGISIFFHNFSLKVAQSVDALTSILIDLPCLVQKIKIAGHPTLLASTTAKNRTKDHRLIAGVSGKISSGGCRMSFSHDQILKRSVPNRSGT